MNLLKAASLEGPVLLEDYHLVEKLANFDRERIPERVVHARGATAKGFFEVTHDITHLTCADFLRAPGVQTPVKSPLLSNDTYHRIHGHVSTREPVWEIACDELGIDYTDIVYEKATDEGIAKITINRPERRNAFRPQTIKELIRAFNDARDDNSVGVIILTGKDGLSPIDLMVETETHRATPGGTGCVKTIGNYAAVLKAQSSAKAKGYSDVLYLDHSCAVFYLFHGAAGFKNHLD
ncbi:hypothetical protein POM88_025922 [Heracleum sosnowskyi]|uniref:Catalase core domain-containing protein n=1 Tax=Heracleum sosnowskyi TaxID=360622 RepID=A0AAD8I5H3_9APIA|nr:hypothetical protein POM88_041827 [Heracleum sosnowskyi]KAK1379178.1 hypothetical protein POM88_025922 [Heracleum sosnowskyi]